MTASHRPRAEERARELLWAMCQSTKRKAGTAERRMADMIADAGGSALDAYFIATHDTLEAREQAAQLGLTKATASTYRMRLYRLGRLRVTDRARNAPISAAEVESIASLYRQGYTMQRIAELRDVGEDRVYNALARAGLSAADRPQLLSANALGDLLGLSGATVRMFVSRGWLINARVGVAKRGGSFGWTRADVVDLLRCREAWVALSPATIRDPELAAFLRREQAQAGGRWHTREDLAAIIGINSYSVSSWATRGELDGLPFVRWGQFACVWLTDAQAVALEAACAPVRAVAGRGEHIVRRAVDRARLQIRAALAGRPRAAAAD